MQFQISNKCNSKYQIVEIKGNYMIYLISLGIIFLILCNGIGNYLASKFNNSVFFHNDFIGLSFLMSIIFILTYPLVLMGVSSSILIITIGLTFFVSLIFSYRYIRFKFSVYEFVFITISISLLLLFSMRFTLGEQMSDSIYVFYQSIKNVDTSIINSFDLGNGYQYDYINLSPTKSYISFYYVFTFFIFIVTKISSLFSSVYIPGYLITVWLSSLFFFYFSSVTVLNIIRLMRINDRKIIAILVVWIGIHTTTIYYNVVFPYIGVTFLGLVLSNLIIILYSYLDQFKRKDTILLFIVLSSMNAYAATGALFIIIASFGIIATTLLKKNREVFLQVALFILPVLHYLLIIKSNVGLLKIFVPLYFSLLLILKYFRKSSLTELIFSKRYWVISIVLVLLLTYSILFIDDYLVKVLAFFNSGAGADRVIDYFTFTNVKGSLYNIVHYIVLISIIVNKESRTLGVFLFIVLLFFINPFLRPFVSEVLSHYEVYNRTFFVLFNTATIGIGLVSFSKITQSQKILRNSMLVVIIIVLSIPTYHQVFGFFYPIYEPRETDYNPIYKMSNNQIQILEKMRQIVNIEQIKNPLIISQIFGTAMYAPEFVVIGYNVNQQRNGPMYLSNELYEIFYTPSVPADDGPRLDAPVRKTCDLLIDSKVDFVIYDRMLSIFDEEIGDYMPIEWYAKDCAELVLKNDRYSLYRFFWR